MSLISKFSSRIYAGRYLARLLGDYAERGDVIVVALPRGGVPVASEIARALDLPLDVLVVRKIGIPGQEEAAMGAIAAGSVRVLSSDVIRAMNLSSAEIEEAIHG